jgi:thiol:disulfide interchange protein DsbD
MFTFHSGFSQGSEPVTWKQSYKQLSDDEYELSFIATAGKDWHFYSQYTEGTMPMSINFENQKGYKVVGKMSEWPKPKEEYDELLGGLTKFWDKTATFKQKIKITSTAEVKVTGYMQGQACINGACTMISYDFKFKFPGAKVVSADTLQKDTASVALVNDTTKRKTDTTALKTTDNVKKENQSWWNIFLFAFLAGLLTLITPCVFPMIPMTVSFFMKGNKSKKSGMKQAYFFGFSIILIFAVLGLLLTLLLGKDAMYIISTHWIPNLIFFFIFMIFALSFFGLFEITMPSWLINKSDKNADKGGYFGTFFVALTTVLVSFSCTGPILGAALIEITSGSNNRLVFLISMLGFAIGFALPFTLLAMFPSVLSKLKSGSWLNTVKIVFGFIEIALGLKFLSMADLGSNWRILDREVFLALWIVVFALLGFYLLGKLKFKGDSELKSIGVFRLFLAIITFSFVMYMIPGMWGAPLKVLSGYIPPLTTQDFDINRTVIENAGSDGNTHEVSDMGVIKYADILHLPTGFKGFFDLEQAKEYAKKVNKPIFVDFTGKTCANCREMENNVWNDPEVKKILNENFVMVALYDDAEFIALDEKEWITPEDGGRVIKTLGAKNRYYQLKRFNLTSQPYYVLMDHDENVLTKENKPYDKHVPNFVAFLKEGMAEFNKRHAAK